MFVTGQEDTCIEKSFCKITLKQGELPKMHIKQYVPHTAKCGNDPVYFSLICY